ncbi:MAG: beta-lactamase family protein [Bauldia sp.]|nr:beta-lactamase family protein [Bauldia sp.]
MARFTFIAIGVAALLGVAGPVLAGEPLATRLETALQDVVASDDTVFPGAILFVGTPKAGANAVAAGVGDIESQAPVTPDARFRAGSVAKPFVATVAMQLVEEVALSLDATLAALLPEEARAGLADADRITLRMLLNHTSGIPDWLTEAAIGQIAADPSRVWTTADFVALAAALPRTFAPGEGWAYSNTDYNLLGAIIERATGMPWRQAVRERVIVPLGLAGTSLPEPGDLSMPAPFMHGYGLIGGQVTDLTFIDPSMAGAAGGGTLVTTVGDLATFLTALRAGRLFKDPTTLAVMTDFVDAEAEGGQTGYSLGLERYVLPGGIEMIGHAGGTAGYRSGMFFFPALDLTMTFALSVQTDPSPVISAALTAVSGTGSP